MSESGRNRLKFIASTWGQSILIAALAVWVIISGANNINYRWQWYRVTEYLFTWEEGSFATGPLIKGLWITLEISILSLILTLVIGLTMALFRLSESMVARALSRGYLELIRNTPLLIQLYLLYFVFGPILGWERITTAVVCLGLFQGAYTAEVFRAGLQAIPRGQAEACRTLGLNAWNSYRYVILPQVIRHMMPPLTNEAVSLVKNSAIVSVIAIFDLTTEGRNIIADTFLTFEIWLTVAAIYLMITISLSSLADMAEKKMRAS